MENGEVAGRGSNSWASWKASKPDWVRDDRVRILVQFGATRAREIPDVPTAVELAPDEATRDLFRFFSMKFLMARPIALPPDVPPERVKALQDAFDATMKDEAFLVDARKIGLEINPVSGAEVAKLVADIQDVPESVVQRLRDVLSGAQAK